MRREVDSVWAQMVAGMPNLPPDQRAMMEQMMRDRDIPGVTAAAAKVEYRQTGSDKVGQWTCMKYEGSLSGQKRAEVCTVDPKEFGLTPTDFEVAGRLSEFMKSMTPPSRTEAAFVNGTAHDGFSGVPVRRMSFRNGAVESVIEVTEVRKQAFPASTFKAPAGFRKVAAPAFLGR
jgi:hypothetical protein